MKLQLDTQNKIIKVDEDVNLGDLVKHLDKLLPKDSPFGHWKEYQIQTNTIINNYSNPIVIDNWRYRGDNWWQSPIYCGTSTKAILTEGNSLVANGENYTINGTSTISYNTNAILNFELN